MLCKEDQKQEAHFIIEIEPSRCNQENQKRRILGYAGKMDTRGFYKKRYKQQVQPVSHKMQRGGVNAET